MHNSYKTGIKHSVHQVEGRAVQDCSNSSALAMEILQSSTKPSKWSNSGQLKRGLETRMSYGPQICYIKYNQSE